MPYVVRSAHPANRPPNRLLHGAVRITAGPLLILAAMSGPALAHASRQAFVLLLPTHYYIAGGVAAVVLTLFLVSVLPDRATRALFSPEPPAASTTAPGIAQSHRRRQISRRLRTACSCGMAGVLALLLLAGLEGADDPTRNPLPVVIWTLFWIGLILLTGVLGNLWRWLNPWTGPLALLACAGIRPVVRLPQAWGHMPALVSFMAFAGFMLIHPAPADPAMLAAMVASYWAVHFAGGLLFGPRWLLQAEAFTLLFAAYGQIAVIGRWRGRIRAGFPGWRALAAPPPTASRALFMLALLAVGSFEGLHQTFFWFARLGLNPLAYEGRAQVMVQNSLGLAAALPVLVLAYSACLWAGAALAGQPQRFGLAFRAFAPALLPIALAYHFAHFLPTLLVDIQSVPTVLTDPLGTGADLFGFGPIHVTTGFFNRLDSARRIWIAMVAAVVAGHVLALLMSHVIAVQVFGSARRARLSQGPIAGFMVLYTLFGLWLLTSPQVG